MPPRRSLPTGKALDAVTKQLYQIIRLALKETGVILIPDQVLNRLREELKLYRKDSTVLQSSFLSEIVDLLNQTENGMYSRLQPPSLGGTLEIILQLPASQKEERALYLISASFYRIPSQIGNERTLKERKITVGRDSVLLLLCYFVDKTKPFGMRRWAGILLLQLLEDAEANRGRIELGPEETRRQLGMLILHEDNEVIRIICGEIVRSMINSGTPLETLWPSAIDKSIYAEFPSAPVPMVKWFRVFQNYVDNLWQKRMSKERIGQIHYAHSVTTFPVSSARSAGQDTLVSICPEELSILIAATDRDFYHSLDISPSAVTSIEVKHTNIGKGYQKAANMAEMIITVGKANDQMICLDSKSVELVYIRLVLDVERVHSLGVDIQAACPGLYPNTCYKETTSKHPGHLSVSDFLDVRNSRMKIVNEDEIVDSQLTAQYLQPSRKALVVISDVNQNISPNIVRTNPKKLNGTASESMSAKENAEERSDSARRSKSKTQNPQFKSKTLSNTIPQTPPKNLQLTRLESSDKCVKQPAKRTVTSTTGGRRKNSKFGKTAKPKRKSAPANLEMSLPKQDSPTKKGTGAAVNTSGAEIETRPGQSDIDTAKNKNLRVNHHQSSSEKLKKRVIRSSERKRKAMPGDETELDLPNKDNENFQSFHEEIKAPQLLDPDYNRLSSAKPDDLYDAAPPDMESSPMRQPQHIKRSSNANIACEEEWASKLDNILGELIETSLDENNINAVTKKVTPQCTEGMKYEVADDLRSSSKNYWYSEAEALSSNSSCHLVQRQLEKRTVRTKIFRKKNDIRSERQPSRSPIIGKQKVGIQHNNTAVTILNNALSNRSLLDDALVRKPLVIGFNSHGPRNQGPHSSVEHATRNLQAALNKDTDLEQASPSESHVFKRQRTDREIEGDISCSLIYASAQRETPSLTPSGNVVEVEALVSGSQPVARAGQASRSSQRSFVDQNGSPIAQAGTNVDHFSKVKRKLFPDFLNNEASAKASNEYLQPRFALSGIPKTKPSLPEDTTPRYIPHREFQNGVYEAVNIKGGVGPAKPLADPFIERQDGPSTNFIGRLKRETTNAVTEPGPRDISPNLSQCSTFTPDFNRTLIGSDENAFDLAHASKLTESSESTDSSVTRGKKDAEKMWNIALRPHYKEYSDALHRIVDEMIINLSNEEEAFGLIIKQYEENGAKLLERHWQDRRAERENATAKIDDDKRDILAAYKEAKDLARKMGDNLKTSWIDSLGTKWKEQQESIRKQITQRAAAHGGEGGGTQS
ncbi:hypothetical protein B7463_g10170, partial [Scytalidium lignicola]